MDLEIVDLNKRVVENITPFVSIWMLTYNQEKFIEQCVESVMNQQANFEYKLFIGEDVSTDNTREICKRLKKKFPNKIELFLNDKNLGVNLNAKKVLEETFNSNAKYIALLEGDDYWTDPYKLQKQVDFLEANSDYVLSFHKVKILKPSGEFVDDFITNVPENYETQETLARLGNYIHTPSVVFRNIKMEFPPEFSLSPVGDYFLYIMLTEHGKLKYLEEEMAVYRYGVGIHSSKTSLNITKTVFNFYSLLLSYSNNPKINQILLERHATNFENFESIIRNEYSESFVSNHVFFKAIKALKTPNKFWKKMKQKLFKK